MTCYFDSAYFDPAYFDTCPVVTSSGGGKGRLRRMPIVLEPERREDEDGLLVVRIL